jgi:hypothetical protein
MHGWLAQIGNFSRHAARRHVAQSTLRVQAERMARSTAGLARAHFHLTTRRDDLQRATDIARATLQRACHRDEARSI